MGNQIEEMAEMLEIIEKSREEWAHDVTDHTENEYIREGLLNAGYIKQSEGAWKKSAHGKYDYFCSACGVKAMSRCYGNNDDLSKFCPNCGAKMKGANNEHSKNSKKS